MKNECTCERPDDNTCDYCEQQSSIQILKEAAEKYSSISFKKQDLYDGFIEGELGCSYPDCICQGDEITYCNNRTPEQVVLLKD